MDDSEFLDGEMTERLRRAGLALSEVERALAIDLWQLRASSEPGSASLASADRKGELGASSGESVAEVVRQTLLIGRALADVASPIDAQCAARISLLTDEAAVRAAAAHTRYLEARREDWLSFFAHEMKNSLNTVLNAIWLLREGRAGANADRFLHLAERGVRRMEQQIQGLRELKQRETSSPPRIPLSAPTDRHQ